MKIEKGIKSNCSEWDTEVYPGDDELEEIYKIKDNELLDQLREIVKVRKEWD